MGIFQSTRVLEYHQSQVFNPQTVLKVMRQCKKICPLGFILICLLFSEPSECTWVMVPKLFSAHLTFKQES